MVDDVLRALSSQFNRMYASEGRAVDCAREVAAGATVADAVLDSQRAAADGRNRLQHVVPLVCGVELGRGGVGRNGVHQKPRPTVGGRGSQAVPSAGGGTGAGEGLD